MSHPYLEYFKSDNDLCVPVLSQEEMISIFSEVESIADRYVGPGSKPRIVIDLENLQVADYAAFPPLTQIQKDTIRKIQAATPIRSDEIAYLALRSLIEFQWNKPQSEEDVNRAAAYERSLEIILTEASMDAGMVLKKPEALLPYWGRLGFLTVMSSIPDEQFKAHQLDRYACILIKNTAFNARSFQYEEHGLIGLNFALEPILKSLNRMILHYMHTEEFAGPKRLVRTWNSFLPIVAYFWNYPVPTNKLAPFHVIFDDKMSAYAHSMTTSQIAFIIRHELGHLVMNHGRKLKAILDPEEADVLRHEFEFSADAFAQGGLRSALYSQLRSKIQYKETDDVADSDISALDLLHAHQAEVTGTRLLLMYMDAIDQLGQLLKDRLGDAIKFRDNRNSHPPARERMARLDAFHISEYPPTSKLLRYAEEFFKNILSYASTLNDKELATSLKKLS